MRLYADLTALLHPSVANHPELETLSKSGIEHLFVKNLENVQGDERDIIVFSITYAKDRDGRLSMNLVRLTVKVVSAV